LFAARENLVFAIAGAVATIKSVAHQFSTAGKSFFLDLLLSFLNGGNSSQILRTANLIVNLQSGLLVIRPAVAVVELVANRCHSVQVNAVVAFFRLGKAKARTIDIFIDKKIIKLRLV
jgi:hypothetical protein